MLIAAPAAATCDDYRSRRLRARLTVEIALSCRGALALFCRPETHCGTIIMIRRPRHSDIIDYSRSHFQGSDTVHKIVYLLPSKEARLLFKIMVSDSG
jgi:hypothetical protein